MTTEAFEAACVASGAGHCPLLVGIPGVAKSRMVDAYARALGLGKDRDSINGWAMRYMKTLFAASREGVDYHGYPVPPSTAGGGVRLEAPYWAMEMKALLDEDPFALVMLFLDELNTGGDDVQKAALSIIDEHRIGDLAPFGPRLVVWAAQNPIELSTGGAALMPALITRVVKIDWELPVSQWIEAARNDFPDPQPVVVPDHWRQFVPMQRNLVTSFLERKPQHALALAGDLEHLIGGTGNNKQSKVNTSEPHANYRTWTKAWECLAAADAVYGVQNTHGDIIRHKLLAGCVGVGTANEFDTWVRSLDLPNPADVLAGRIKVDWAKLGARPDRAHTVLMGVAALAQENPDALKAASFWRIMEDAWKTPTTHDIVIVAVRGTGLRLHKMGYKAPEDLTELMADVVSRVAAAGRR